MLRPPRSDAPTQDSARQEIGWIGELHPRLRQVYEFPQAPVVFELDVAAALEHALPRVATVPRFPVVQRDLALWFNETVRYQDVLDTVAALAAMSAVKIATLDRLIAGDRHDPILIVGKTIGLEWATVRSLILLRLGPNRIAAPADIETARVNFTRLMPSTAERVVGFWQTRQSA